MRFSSSVRGPNSRTRHAADSAAAVPASSRSGLGGDGHREGRRPGPPGAPRSLRSAPAASAGWPCSTAPSRSTSPSDHERKDATQEDLPQPEHGGGGRPRLLEGAGHDLGEQTRRRGQARLLQEDGRQGRGGRGDPALGERPAQFVEGAVDPHPGGVGADGEACADLGEREILEETQEDRLAVRFVQVVQRLVDDGPQLVPVGFRGGVHFVHGLGLLLVGSAALRGTHRLGRGEPGAGVEPAGEGLAAQERCGFARQVGEDALGHVIGKVPVAPDAPQGGKVHHVEVPAHEFGERFFRAILEVPAQQLGIFQHGVRV